MRAHRYPLQVTIRYRRLADQAWSEGKTENISRSGVLFSGEGALSIDTEIEISIALSAATPVTAAADLVCRARVVRTHRAGFDDADMLAAAFSDYRFEKVSA